MDKISVTLFFKTYDKVLRKYMWSSKIYDNAIYTEEHSANISAGNINGTGKYIVRIFTDELIPVNLNDIAVKGSVEQKFESDVDIKKAFGNDCFVVLKIKDNRRGTEKMRHWKVGGE